MKKVSPTNPMMGRSVAIAGSGPDQDLGYEYRRQIGAFVREARLKAGMTQEELGKILGIRNTAVSAFEGGRSTISPERYEVLASVFNLDRKDFGKFLLRWSNPWIYELIFEDSPAVRRDLKKMPTRI